MRDRTGWGNLPDGEIAKAKAALTKNLPPQYRRAIEAYTKKIAGRKGATE
ncbi:MAG: hypothetical protein ACE5KM_13995 [Planctomycetaceae bacterium]